MTVELQDELTTASHTALEAAVLRFRPRERALSPTRFFELRDRVLALASALNSAAQDCGVDSVRQLAEDASDTLQASSYMIAIVGPQRVGKSTLVNALLGVDVSPIADYPTTAVPLLFEAGATGQAEVLFADGQRTTVEATARALRPFAAQQENDSNAKGVRLVRVSLLNDMLARGVSLVDTPGLHDASSLVRDVTQSAIENSDAILYVLDASLRGKFKLGQSEIEDLAALQKSKERVIVVLNQADGLDEADRTPLLGYVEGMLKKHGLWNGLPVTPLFASGKEAWEARSRNSAPPTLFRELEDQLWGHLLKNRGTGLHRLATAVVRLSEACETGEALLSDRIKQGSEAAELDHARETCKRGLTDAMALGKAWRTRVKADIVKYLDNAKLNRLSALSVDLGKVNKDGAFPTSAQVDARLRKEVIEDGQAVWAVLQRETSDITSAFGELVQKALQESRAQLGIPVHPRMFVSARAMPPIDLSLPEEGLGLLGGILGFFANPALGIATTIVGWIYGRDVAIERRHQRVISLIKKRYEERLDEGLLHLGGQAIERVFATDAALMQQTKGRLETFIADAERRISRLGTPVPKAEAARLGHLAAELGRISDEAELIGRELEGVLDEGHTEAA